MKKSVYALLILVLCAIFGYQISEYIPTQTDTQGKLAVSFIDVGQGDSTFIEFPGGKTALIDAGEADCSETVIAYLQSRQCKTIDYVICTHPHSDHIGGMAEVLKSFDIGEIYMPRVSHTTNTYERLLLAVQNKGLTIHTAKAGVTISVEPEITMTMVAPNAESYEEMNDYSAVVRLTYGDNAFLFTGDAETVSEKEILDSGQSLGADVLKVGHHGSSTSTHKSFLKAVAPSYAVISCGDGNDYGHPHNEIVNRLKKCGAQIYRTDLHGTVLAISDGNRIAFVTEEE